MNGQRTHQDRFNLLPGEEDFDVILNDPDFVPHVRGSSMYSQNSAQLAAASDAPTGGGGGGTSHGTSASGATEKQRSFITSLATERGLEIQPRWFTTKATASDAIEKLLATPKPAAAPVAHAGHPATDKQKAFVRTLLAERAGNPEAEVVRTRLNDARLSGSLNTVLVSECITALLEIPKEAPVEAEAGVYVLANGNLARVYFGQQSGHMLLKEVVDGELEYRGQAHRFLDGSRKATVEEVGNWGRATGTCLVCSRRLDDPESVDRGIGPVCYARMTGEG